MVWSASVGQSVEIVANTWEESTTSWNTRPADNPTSPVTTTAGASVWTVNNGDASVVSLDVSAQVRKKLRQGDINFDSIKGNTGTPSDITADVMAFEMAVKDPAAFDAAFGSYISDDSDLFDRADINGDGVINAEDGEAFLAIHGILQGDRDFDGDVDDASFLEWQRIFGTSATYFEGDVDFSGIVDGGDLDVWAANFNATPPAPAEEKISLRLFAPGPQPSALEYVGYGSKENSNRRLPA